MTQVHPIIFEQIPELSTLRSGYPAINTFLFDMDGTLFDTEKFHALALKEMGKKYRITPPLSESEIYELMVGKADHLLFDIIKDWPGFPKYWTSEEFIKEKNSLLLDLLKNTSSEIFFPSEMKRLLNEIHQSGHQLGLVTSSEKIITIELLKIADLKNIFHLVLTRDDCPKVKPDPWPYLEAMRLLKSESHMTLIFEDSFVGIEAARNSQAHVIKAMWY
jgi:beta-phosphoglucomutase